MTLQPRVVLVHRHTEYEELLMRHGTRQAAAFFLATRERDIESLAARHQAALAGRHTVSSMIPSDWRRAEIERSDLHRFSFTPEDVVAVIGQDGLVANVAKYLTEQPVIGFNPDPERNPGVLVPHRPDRAQALFDRLANGTGAIEHRTMVSAVADDGQTLYAVNEVYFGHRGHQSARYRIEQPNGTTERQSSSGVLAGTGTGATGWVRSPCQERRSPLLLPEPEEQRLCWFVREAWPSIATGTTMTEGLVSAGESLRLHAESDELVCFGDGIEADSLRITWGQTLTISPAPHTLHLLVD